MTKEANEQNGNEKDINHRILSWCGEHKMKAIAIAIVVALASLSGGYWYQEQQVTTFDMSASIAPTTVIKNNQMTLTVTIMPKQSVNGEFEVVIKPQDSTYIHLDEGIPFDEVKNSWTINLGKLNLRQGEDRPFVYYMSATCPSTSAGWWVEIYVRYKPEGSEVFTDELMKKLTFTVKEENEGYDWPCLGTSLLAMLVLMGWAMKKRK